MAQVDLSPSRRTKVTSAIVIVLIHIAVIAGLIRAFAPDLTDQVVESVTTAFTVTITSPPPEPEPKESPEPEEEGAAAPPGKKAKPKEVAAPEAKIPVTKQPAPKVASKGNDNSSGARDEGAGTGAGGVGDGTGSGRGGDGQGGGASKAIKIAGDINSARDYPKESRELRLGDHVILALTVGTDGRVKNCRIHRPSRDPDADRITCQLATERFRFKPATDGRGNPVQSVYGWKQRWFKPGKS